MPRLSFKKAAFERFFEEGQGRAYNIDVGIEGSLARAEGKTDNASCEDPRGLVGSIIRLEKIKA